jgi:hypothetical protein
MSSSGKIILENPEDWDPWLEQTQTSTDERVWKLIDPDISEAEAEFLREPTLPTVRRVNSNAGTIAQLSAAEQATYQLYIKQYEQKLKGYEKQQTHVRHVRELIRATVSKRKNELLERNETTRAWLRKLKEHTKLPSQQMRSRVEQQYSSALKGFKPVKVDQWLERWEHAISLARKHELPHISNGNWLEDLSRVVRPFSNALGYVLSQRASNPEENDIKNYHKVSLEIRSEMTSLTKKSFGTGTMRGGTFKADFAGEPEEETPAGNSKGKGGGQSTKRKRTGTTSGEEEAPTNKKSKVEKCPACELRGHNLPDCWYLFEEKRPEGYKVSKARLEKTNKRIETDKDLAAQIEKLKTMKDEEDLA